MRAPQAIYIATGSELTSGRRPETNGEKLARWLETIGCEVHLRLMAADRRDLLARTVTQALSSDMDVVVVTGGLGPTADDVTREAIAESLGVGLELDEGSQRAIEKRYEERGRTLPAGAKRQALRPAGSELIQNPIGTAPGFLVRHGHTLLVVLPGVPREFEVMFQRKVLPELKSTLAGAAVYRSGSLHVVGLTESEVDERVAGAFSQDPDLQLSMVAQRSEVEILVTSRARAEEEAEERLGKALRAIEAGLGIHVYGRGEESLVGVVGGLLESRGWHLAVAESLSGGLLAKRITDVPGSSRYFAGGVIAYANALKSGLLDVPQERLLTCGAVSGEVAEAMARGTRRRLGAEVAVATTGIAGPTGGSTDKPVGLVYLAVEWPDGLRVVRHLFAGNRNVIRSWSCASALEEIRRALLGLPALGEPVLEAGGDGCG